MILMISSSPRAQDYAAAVSQGTGRAIQLAPSGKRASALLRAEEFAVVIVDQALLERDPRAIEALIARAGAAIPVFVPLAICSPARVLNDVRAALARREMESRLADQAARRRLSSELCNDVTAILQSSELALREPALPRSAQEKLKSVVELAQQMRTRLEA
ncbi:MAG: hypothetical protein L0099_14585 [Acidobacteria bacterium]|nr:hypothetical protein [Acidobacteriota bacterium]